MIEAIGHSIDKLVDEALMTLARAEHFRAGSFVTMPVTYPSGASVVLEITQQRDRFFVSDRAGGYHEAEYMGASRAYPGEAERFAKDAGIRFDGRDMFVAEVSVEQLAGAFVVVANCSQKAVISATLKVSDREQKDLREELLTRLDSIFPEKALDRSGKISGPKHVWKIAAVVTANDNRAAFDVVTAHYNSVVSTAAKFHDLGRLSTPPRMIAIVRNEKALRDYAEVLRGAIAEVVEITASNKKLLEMVA